MSTAISPACARSPAGPVSWWSWATWSTTSTTTTRPAAGGRCPALVAPGTVITAEPLPSAPDDVLAARCPGCGYRYEVASGDEHEGFAAGTSWSEIPADWTCPDCGVRDKLDFVLEAAA